MSLKPTIVLIEDNESWMNSLTEIINQYLKSTVQLQAFISFPEARKRLLKMPFNIDLLITDVYPDDGSRITLGLKFADFAHHINKIPVIVVTGDSNLVRNTPKDDNYNYIKAFDKGDFDQMDFITCIKKILKPPSSDSIEIIPVEPKISPNNMG